MRKFIFIVACGVFGLPAMAAENLEIEKVKKGIVAIAKSDFAREGNQLVVRNILDPLVNTLVEMAPSQSEDERAALGGGGWKSLWTDQGFGPGTDLDQVYQVVSPNGFYYNISKNDSPRGVVTNFLRGAYTSQGSYLAIEFTANSISPSFFQAGTDLSELAQNFEDGAIQGISIPGPIGVTGVLMNIYVDKTLRIVYGNSTADVRPRLFLLERADVIVE